MKEEVENPSDEKFFKHIGRIRWGGRKRGHSWKVFSFLKFDKEESELIEDLIEEFDDTIIPKRVRDSDLHNFFEIRCQKK